jgi:hypothetical protein
MNIILISLVHLFILIVFVTLNKMYKIKNYHFFSPLNILFMFTMLYVMGFYARYFFYYDIYFWFISDYSYLVYSLYLFTFFLIFFLTFISVNPKTIINTIHKSLSKIELSISKSKFLFKSFFVYFLAIILMVLLIKKTGILPFNDPLEFRIQAGHNFGILFVLMLYFFSLPLFYSMYLLINQKISKFTFLSITFFTILIYFFFGSRMLLLSLVVNSIMIYSFYKPKVSKSSALVKKTVMIIFAIFFIVLYGSYRDASADMDSFSKIFDFIFNDFWNIFLFYVSEPLVRFSQFVHFLWIIEHEQTGLLSMLYGESLLNSFTTFIPRFIYEDKPLFLSMEIQKTLSGSSETPRTASGYFFAEAYLNLYWYSLFIYPIVLGFIVKLLMVLYKLSQESKNFIFFFIYKDIMWYMYIIYDGLNSISLQLLFILIILDILAIKFFQKSKRRAING